MKMEFGQIWPGEAHRRAPCPSLPWPGQVAWPPACTVHKMHFVDL
ncbi:hypothetical protein A2U01_0118217, partial [Trifolium medium]|nr:hypothetical protein [Trifolium medium]